VLLVVLSGSIWKKVRVPGSKASESLIVELKSTFETNVFFFV
jgi:hypothetical protein